ncbi:MAG: protein-disulfide reductase DsbD family protein [Pseudolabrys sp.]|nr:protein-disulfide reductase DsbD family protein [Pseudolabrys sp.]
MIDIGSIHFRHTGLALILCGAVLLPAAPARAADASAWSQDSKSAIRLIAGANKADDTAFRAGIEVKLQPGWHTYWRYPGDSGLPPRFDFSGSDNVKTAKVRYPAPSLFSDGAGNSIGYSGTVIFPVQVVPGQAGKPVTLRLKLEYAVCEKLCVPAEGRAELPVGTGPSANEASLAAAEAQVPVPASTADLELSVRRVNDAPKPLVAVDLKTLGGKAATIFVEGPNPEWALPIPKPAQGAPPGRQHFGFELDGLPPGVSPKGPFELTFTVVEDGRAVEIKTHLD